MAVAIRTERAPVIQRVSSLYWLHENVYFYCEPLTISSIKQFYKQGIRSILAVNIFVPLQERTFISRIMASFLTMPFFVPIPFLDHPLMAPVIKKTIENQFNCFLDSCLRLDNPCVICGENDGLREFLFARYCVEMGMDAREATQLMSNPTPEQLKYIDEFTEKTVAENLPPPILRRIKAI